MHWLCMSLLSMGKNRHRETDCPVTTQNTQNTQSTGQPVVPTSEVPSPKQEDDNKPKVKEADEIIFQTTQRKES